MSTNYYAHDGAHDGAPEPRHIGKGSIGWCFALRVYPKEGIHTLDDWRPIFERSRIVNQWGEELTAAEMLAQITDRRGDPAWMIGRTTGYYLRNHAVPGPRHLMRHQIDGLCVGHGEGTWDYLMGDFS